MSDHAKFAPSSMARIMACSGYLNLRGHGVLLDEDDTPQSLEGTAAHWVASEALEDRWAVAGSLAPNGIAVTEEMLEGAELWADTVRPYLDGGRIEKRVDCNAVHPDCWGTPDFYQVGETIHVADYKFGHRYVNPIENWQLLTYAAGIIPSDWPDAEIVLTVVQPRSYHRDGPVRTWRLRTEELAGYVNRISAACEAAESPRAVCKAGPECYQCPVRHVCETALSAELSAFDLAGSTVPLNLPPEAKALRLHQVRRALDLLKQMESGVSEDVTAMIRTGAVVPGFSLESSTGREKWNVSVEEVIALGTALGVDVAKPGAITPNQARKAGLPADLVAAYSERASGSISLVESDPAQLMRIFK